MSEMTFEKLLKDTQCDILKDTFVDNTSTFIRRVKRITLRVEDFESKWEKNEKRPEKEYIEDWIIKKKSLTKSDYSEVANLKGVSVDAYTMDTLSEIIARHRTQMAFITRNKCEYICLFKLNHPGGKFRYSPIPQENQDHHDLYKSDQFSYKHHIQAKQIVHIDDAEVLKCL